MTNIDEVRAAFEAKFSAEYLNKRRGDHYRVWTTECLWQGWQAAYAAGRRKGLEEAADAIECANDSAGDRAAYDNREMYDSEAERMQTVSDAVKTIRTLIDKEGK